MNVRPDLPRIAPQCQADVQRTSVILVHGMLASHRSMRPIADSLSDLGMHVTSWRYSTLIHSIRDHADRLARVVLRHLADRDVETLHFVGHSMGCIILRQTLLRFRLSGARFVMLAPPNGGSRLTRLPSGPLARWFPPFAELAEHRDSLVNRLPSPTGLDVGVVAARWDRVVELEATRLRCSHEHLVVSATHQRLPRHEEAVRQVQHFLLHGCFDRPAVTRRSDPRRRAA
ncbi:esterase/lipase family protein [Crateriforma spongiae]|uniref:esterase/lipase family protein n=1 Tax=Crateriforma spongiae TaxID=2724528 RepID=UPI001445B3FC|nr:alpha/beta fold hydrolase [Crateriforma spongiae]